MALVLAGATLSFLRFNFHPATIFMGDAGAMFLGFVLGVLSVQGVMKSTATVALILPLLVLGVPFIDLFLIVFRRLWRRVPFYSPGQDHVHHDLVLVAGFSQRKSAPALRLVHPAQRHGGGHEPGLVRRDRRARRLRGGCHRRARGHPGALASRYHARGCVPGGDAPPPQPLPSGRRPERRAGALGAHARGTAACDDPGGAAAANRAPWPALRLRRPGAGCRLFTVRLPRDGGLRSARRRRISVGAGSRAHIMARRLTRPMTERERAFRIARLARETGSAVARHEPGARTQPIAHKPGDRCGEATPYDRQPTQADEAGRRMRGRRSGAARRRHPGPAEAARSARTQARWPTPSWRA